MGIRREARRKRLRRAPRRILAAGRWLGKHWNSGLTCFPMFEGAPVNVSPPRKLEIPLVFGQGLGRIAAFRFRKEEGQDRLLAQR